MESKKFGLIEVYKRIVVNTFGMVGETGEMLFKEHKISVR
jgi:hypothetical protein